MKKKRAEALKTHKIKLLRNKRNDYSSLDENKDATTMKTTTVIQTNRSAEQKPPERFTNWTNTHQLSLQQTHPLTAQTTWIYFICFMQSVLLLKHEPEFMKEMNFYIMCDVIHNLTQLIQWLTETRVMILMSVKTCRNIHGFGIKFMN